MQNKADLFADPTSEQSTGTLAQNRQQPQGIRSIRFPGQKEARTESQPNTIYHGDICKYFDRLFENTSYPEPVLFQYLKGRRTKPDSKYSGEYIRTYLPWDLESLTLFDRNIALRENLLHTDGMWLIEPYYSGAYLTDRRELELIPSGNPYTTARSIDGRQHTSAPWQGINYQDEFGREQVRVLLSGGDLRPDLQINETTITIRDKIILVLQLANQVLPTMIIGGTKKYSPTNLYDSPQGAVTILELISELDLQSDPRFSQAFASAVEILVNQGLSIDQLASQYPYLVFKKDRQLLILLETTIRNKKAAPNRPKQSLCTSYDERYGRGAAIRAIELSNRELQAHMESRQKILDAKEELRRISSRRTSELVQHVMTAKERGVDPNFGEIKKQRSISQKSAEHQIATAAKRSQKLIADRVALYTDLLAGASDLELLAQQPDEFINQKVYNRLQLFAQLALQRPSISAGLDPKMAGFLNYLAGGQKDATNRYTNYGLSTDAISRIAHTPALAWLALDFSLNNAAFDQIFATRPEIFISMARTSIATLREFVFGETDDLSYLAARFPPANVDDWQQLVKFLEAFDAKSAAEALIEFKYNAFTKERGRNLSDLLGRVRLPKQRGWVNWKKGKPISRQIRSPESYTYWAKARRNLVYKGVPLAIAIASAVTGVYTSRNQIADGAVTVAASAGDLLDNIIAGQKSLLPQAEAALKTETSTNTNESKWPNNSNPNNNIKFVEAGVPELTPGEALATIEYLSRPPKEPSLLFPSAGQFDKKIKLSEMRLIEAQPYEAIAIENQHIATGEFIYKITTPTRYASYSPDLGGIILHPPLGYRFKKIFTDISDFGFSQLPDGGLLIRSDIGSQDIAFLVEQQDFVTYTSESDLLIGNIPDETTAKYNNQQNIQPAELEEMKLLLFKRELQLFESEDNAMIQSLERGFQAAAEKGDARSLAITLLHYTQYYRYYSMAEDALRLPTTRAPYPLELVKMAVNYPDDGYACLFANTLGSQFMSAAGINSQVFGVDNVTTTGTTGVVNIGHALLKIYDPAGKVMYLDLTPPITDQTPTSTIADETITADELTALANESINKLEQESGSEAGTESESASKLGSEKDEPNQNADVAIDDEQSHLPQSNDLLELAFYALLISLLTDPKNRKKISDYADEAGKLTVKASQAVKKIMPAKQQQPDLTTSDETTTDQITPPDTAQTAAKVAPINNSAKKSTLRKSRATDGEEDGEMDTETDPKPAAIVEAAIEITPALDDFSFRHAMAVVSTQIKKQPEPPIALDRLNPQDPLTCWICDQSIATADDMRTSFYGNAEYLLNQIVDAWDANRDIGIGDGIQNAVPDDVKDWIQRVVGLGLVNTSEFDETTGQVVIRQHIGLDLSTQEGQAAFANIMQNAPAQLQNTLWYASRLAQCRANMLEALLASRLNPPTGISPEQQRSQDRMRIIAALSTIRSQAADIRDRPAITTADRVRLAVLERAVQHIQSLGS